MTVSALSPAPVRWDPPAAIRGTLVVLHGRGEHGGVYERLGRRLAADGYAVAAPDLPAGEDAALARPAVVGRPDVPFVLIGSDTGAIRAIELAYVLDPRPAALVLAGLPLATPTTAGTSEHGTADIPDNPCAESPARQFGARQFGAPVFGAPGLRWEDEIAARTGCPVHAARLADDSRVVRGALSEPVGPVPTALPDVATLIIHGADDRVADLAAARALARTSPNAYLAVVDGGRHDILNDATHRSVAAHIVLFLESVRAGHTLVAVEPA
jgi:pimeloyl-ACP methyl ester carboxylesterase